jgi:hypothetical protein
MLKIKHPSEDRSKQSIVIRGDNLTQPATVDGIYNQLLFDLCGDNDLVSLSLYGAYNKAIDAIGVVNSSVQHIHEDMIVYVAASGAAADTPTSGVHTDPCAAGNSVESGGCSFELTGWGRLRRTSETRDITDVIEKYCASQPIYDIAGDRIENDYEWDVVRLAAVILQDFHRLLITGNNAVAGQADGLEQLVTYGYQDPSTDELCGAMDSTVIDYNNNAVCPVNGATAVTYNGALVTDGYKLFDFIKSFLRRTAQRVNMSSLVGAPLHIALATTETINCLINCYVCDIVCGSDVERMDSVEARQEIGRLRQEFGANSAVLLSFEGYPVIFYAYDWALYDSVADNSDIYILTPTVGNQPLLRVQMKDMSGALTTTNKSGTEFNVTDQNRVLSWETWDHTCYTVSVEMQWRVYCPAPWAQMRIMNVKCDTPLGGISNDPLSNLFIEDNLVAHAEA